LLGKDLPVDLSSWRGGFLPTGEEVVLEYNDVFFLGDAAGLIHPFTGEGIYYALFSAESLAQSLLSNGDYAEMLWPVTT
jgi:geranylgeranyl reductase